MRFVDRLAASSGVRAQQAFPSTERMKWFQRKDCNVIAANWIDCAYVHFHLDREAFIGKIMKILLSRDVHPIGCYGLWDYISMEDSIYSGIEAARKVIA